MNAEQKRLEEHRLGKDDWRLWGPYLSERAWGTVREDYSPGGTAWEDFDHDQARSRAYRWSEDGIGGLCDESQRLCLALAMWNGRDPILKERAFGLTGNQGNRGEDVKEYFFYLDATPSHSFLRYRYHYPQEAYPYAMLVGENARRGRQDPPFSLLDTGVFGDNRFWGVEIVYAKASSTEIHVQIRAHNNGPEMATLHLLPTLWFRNTWSWHDGTDQRPALWSSPAPGGARWSVEAEHPTLGTYYLYGRQKAELLFTENESNAERLWGQPNVTPYVKDAFHRRLIQNDASAVSPHATGTKAAAWHVLGAKPDETAEINLVLSASALTAPFKDAGRVVSARRNECEQFYRGLLPEAEEDDHRIMRQALAGMIWCKQFFHYDVARWLDGDRLPPPEGHRHGRNRGWKHMKAADVISMPDAWEYPWFAAWDLAFHTAALALIDVDFAKDQIELMLRDRYLHPNGQIPAYEWSFNDANPPVHAMGALKAFRAERVQRGEADFEFLKRVFHKLLLNYAWWINRKDSEGENVFEGGFLGLDNISVFDRSNLNLPPGWRLKQADATGWMAMFALNMTVMALELCHDDASYDEMAIQTYEQFLAIANTMAGYTKTGVSLWDPDTKFFKDLVVTPDGRYFRIDVYSWVGLIPLFASEVIDKRLLASAPRFAARLTEHSGGKYQGHIVSACPVSTNDRGEHLLALVDWDMLPHILERVLDENQFLSSYGVRSVSRAHATQRHLGTIPEVGDATIEYVPGESTSGLFGGNSNWRGPVWMPTNFVLVQALEKFHRFLGEEFTVPVPCEGGREMNLKEVATLLAERLVDLYRRDEHGRVPAMPPESPFQDDPSWKDFYQFYEYFHGETGQGLGAAHQTGWTGLVANLVFRRYRTDIPTIWRRSRLPRRRTGTRVTSRAPSLAGGESVASSMGQMATVRAHDRE